MNRLAEGTVIPQSRTVHYETAISILECWNCAVDFGIGVDFQKRRREDGQVFYCPNGHGNFYNKGKTAQEAELARTQAQLDAVRSLARREAERARTAEYQRRAAKGQLTKARKRAAAGVCPCCQRTFANVARHMAGQHPEFPAVDQ